MKAPIDSPFLSLQTWVAYSRNRTKYVGEVSSPQTHSSLAFKCLKRRLYFEKSLWPVLTAMSLCSNCRGRANFSGFFRRICKSKSSYRAGQALDHHSSIKFWQRWYIERRKYARVI